VIEAISEQLDKLNMLSHQSHHNFCSGDLVRVKQGPLQDLEMVFIGPTTPSKRVHVLLHFLGRLKEVQVDVETLEKMPGESDIQRELNIQPERYTRGKGRKIKHLV
jgi:transcription antitermination factor NusG